MCGMYGNIITGLTGIMLLGESNVRRGQAQTKGERGGNAFVCVCVCVCVCLCMSVWVYIYECVFMCFNVCHPLTVRWGCVCALLLMHTWEKLPCYQKSTCNGNREMWESVLGEQGNRVRDWTEGSGLGCWVGWLLVPGVLLCWIGV
jgi:hypothetical protein